MKTDGGGRRARVSRIKKLDMSCSVLLFPPLSLIPGDCYIWMRKLG